MANTSETNTLYFESTGGNRAYGVSGQTNITQPFVNSGEEYSHLSTALSLPILEADGWIVTHPVASGSIKLPKLATHGATGAVGAISLPAVTQAGAATVPNLLRGELILPELQLSGSAKQGAVTTGAVSLSGRWTIRSTWGNHVAVTLPAPQADGHVLTSAKLTSTVSLPHLHADGTISLTYGVVRGAVTLPQLWIGGSTRGAIMLPPLLALGGITAGGAVYQSWAMNVELAALTRFDNYPFKAIVRFKQAYYGIGFGGGLFKLETGSLDNTANIPWGFETGSTDLDSPGIKGVLGVYVDGLIESAVSVGLVTDNKRTYSYLHVPNGDMDHRPHRIPTGKGIRTRNVGVSVSGEGGYVEIDAIQPEYVVSKRNL